MPQQSNYETHVNWENAQSLKEKHLELHRQDREQAAQQEAVEAIAGVDDVSAADIKAMGACSGVDPDIFFPEKGGDTKTPKKICADCVIRDLCLEYALQNGERIGIWGGTSERERRRIRRSRVVGRRALSSEAN